MMAETGFLEQNRVRPGAVATVVLMHGAALAALLLVKNPEIVRRTFTEIDTFNVRPVLPLPPLPPTPQPETPRVQIETYTVPPIPTPARREDSPVVRDPAPLPPQREALAGNEDLAGPVLPPRREVVVDPPRPAPVRTAAQLTSGDLQPPYPTAEQRMEREGRVVIRVTIGADGRVHAAEKVSATSNAFYEATERHARARWRFRPATVDGRPVETTRTMTVVFQLDG
jgi:protein TonB